MSQSRRGLCFSHVAKCSWDDLETERHYRGTVDPYCLFEIVPFRQLMAFFRPSLLQICGQKLSPTVNQVTLNQPFSSRLSFCFVLMCLFLFKLGADGRINPNISAGIGIWLTSLPSLDQFLQFLLHSRGIAHMEFHHITNWQEHTNSNTLNVHKLFVHCM